MLYVMLQRWWSWCGDFEKSMFYDTIQIMFGRGPRKETSTQQIRTAESTEHASYRDVSGRVLREVCRSLQQHDPERQRKERISFLKTTRAIPLDPRLYALWLYWYIIDGGRITHQEECNYPLSTCRVDDDRKEYYNQPIFWAPGENEEGQIPKIPVGYGPNALTAIHFPDIIRLDLDLENNPEQYYGHTTLLTLQLDPSDPSRLRASTNRPDSVKSFVDITDALVGLIPQFNPDRSKQKFIEEIQKRKRQHELYRRSR